jgi:hypothetical protein
LLSHYGGFDSSFSPFHYQSLFSSSVVPIIQFKIYIHS